MKINRINYPNGVGLFSINIEKKNNTRFNNNGTNFVTELPDTRHYYNLTKINAISFMGKKVYILDGGNHATNMEHFAHAVSKDMDTEIVKVSTIKGNPNMKSLKSLEQQLKKLRQNRSVKNTYVAIPALAGVPILNLQDQYNAVMNENKKFTIENLKSNKENILEFLKLIYENRKDFRKYIDYMDESKQGIEYAYGVIQEINKLIKNGANVYVTSGHLQDQTLKWLAGQRGLKPELYNFIATGQDKNGLIFGLRNEIKNKNWYELNLLSLSDANVVAVKGVKGHQDYMFSVYDSCVNDGARGVYNFTPIRKNNKIVGYSYTDEKTIEYPFDEFPTNKEVANIAKFVGLKLSDVLATDYETRVLKENIKNGYAGRGCANKLYKVKDIFTPEQIVAQKIYLQGEFVDKSLKLFFSQNDKGDVIFKKCDCEGSGKPSVLSMWGSCFAVFNAIARDIQLEKNRFHHSDKEYHSAYIKNLLQEVHLHSIILGDKKRGEELLNKAIQEDKAFVLANPNETPLYSPHMLLGDLHFHRDRYEPAAACYNNALDSLAKELTRHKERSLLDIQNACYRYRHIKDISEKYDTKLMLYNKLPLLQRIFNESEPEKPKLYNQHYKIEEKERDIFRRIDEAANMYKRLAHICMHKGEFYPAKVCRAAADDIRKFSDRGIEVLLARANGVHYIGDIYNEIKPY